jgi:hypothetical protein
VVELRALGRSRPIQSCAGALRLCEWGRVTCASVAPTSPPPAHPTHPHTLARLQDMQERDRGDHGLSGVGPCVLST